MPVQSPTVRQRRLGRELRSLREDAGLTPEQAAQRLGWSRPKLNRIENARIKVTWTDVADACGLYDAGSEKQAALIQLAKDAHIRGWWTAYADVFSGSYVGLEDEADVIRDWAPQLIPGLLQTERYAETVIRLGRPDEDATLIRRRVAARMTRKLVLTRDRPARLDAILDEAVIRRPIGSQDVMNEQMRMLLELGKRPNVSIRVVPFDVGEHHGLEGTFIVLSFAEEIDPDVVYVESHAGDLYLETPQQVGRRKMNFGHLAGKALLEDQSAELIASAIT